MAKKPRAAKSNTLGLKNKAKTAQKRAAKKKAKPLSKVKSKVQARANASANSKKAKVAHKQPVKKSAKVKEAIDAKKKTPALVSGADDQEIANRVLFTLAKESEPHAEPNVNPAENFLHSKGKALRADNAKFTRHARDMKRGGFNARLPGAQVGKRGK
jgi:hypothetical protein